MPRSDPKADLHRYLRTAIGHRAEQGNVPPRDESWWREHRSRIEAAALAARGEPPTP